MEKARTILLGLRLVCVTALPLLPLFLSCPAHAQFAFTTNADGSLNVSDYTNTPATGGTVVVPDTTNGLPITSIGISAFFLGTTITNVIMGTNIANIGAQAFSGCFGLASVTMPDKVTNIGLACFDGCHALTNVTLPNSLTSIAYETFLDCNSLTSISLPNSIRYIGGAAFSGCTSLINVTIPFGVTNIDSNAFQSTALSTVAIPSSVSNIGTSAFSACYSLRSITIPDGVTSIFQYTFQACTILSSVTIGSGVTNIAGNAFFGCTNLTSVYFKGNAPTVGTLFGSGMATAYYLPGTTGWGPTFGFFWPTVLWNPQVQTADGRFGVGPDGFGFTIAGSSNLVIVVQAATNLANPIWLPVSTNTLNTFVGTNGTSYFSDPGWTNYATRFYRFRSP